jgi:predicted Zn-dependent peptidase
LHFTCQPSVCLHIQIHRDPEPEALAALTLDGVRGVLEAQLHPCNLELNVAGDFEEEELEALVLNFMGE